jgi:dTDP-4-amino-4,6-dideoxygalactose transaminase
MFGLFHGQDEYTTVESERLVRLPLYFNLSEDDLKSVINKVASILEAMK